MGPLIITSNDPQVPEGPDQVEQIIEEAAAAYRAGAAIIHLHLIFKPARPGEYLSFDIERSTEVIRGVRERCPGAIVQVGKTTATNESRIALANAVGIDMLSMTLSDNDKFLSQGIPANHRERSEFTEMAGFCLEHDILPEVEVFHAGAAWNLYYLIKEGVLRAPYWVNICLYHEGGGWSPRTMAEVDYRINLLPEGALWHLTAFAHPQKQFVVTPTTPDEHTRLLTYAILKGGHVRTGKEDRPEIRPGVRASSNAELVAMMADLATRLGRPVATPAQAREILGLSPARAEVPTS
ncbi:BKACE family enzyme [Actinacidiphila epipremni]|jgi:3-keto-5-aminohexanoate cleavage enzyme|uniref:3-keto-5-aminohexanoate cleavage protein n=1 Tax=Actinacidiphila epipremni TaxID=2053013 RepID=A0ABX0ZYM7_9ACTN|nr:3-keto-5-aminohexanoate cleavage protein [Actinacidiphila epipremni]NJP46814.1 3-keto-5-aminohexanoate cleavage protein [Actinacidiphila epipremni]